MTPPPIRQPVRIIGIDAGLRRTGWGVIEIDGNRLTLIGCGSVEPPDNLPLASRLLGIHEGLAAVLGDFRPAEAAVEQTFVNKDGVATLKLGQARGVAMLAPAMFGISVAEYAPNQVKKTVVGAGHADKNQIAVMLKILLPKADPKSSDAADALAIAITHAHHRQGAELRLKVAGKSPATPPIRAPTPPPGRGPPLYLSLPPSSVRRGRARLTPRGHGSAWSPAPPSH